MKVFDKLLEVVNKIEKYLVIINQLRLSPNLNRFYSFAFYSNSLYKNNILKNSKLILIKLILIQLSKKSLFLKLVKNLAYSFYM